MNGDILLYWMPVTAWPDTQLHMQEICDKAMGTWDIKKIAISHGTGEVLVGQPSVVIAVSSAHRKAALEVGVVVCISAILNCPLST